MKKDFLSGVLLYLLNLLWVALRKRSVTISLLFALTLQGISVGGHLREIFRSVGMIWPAVWILPFILVWLLARHEPDWLPHQELRTWLSLGLVSGSILFTVALSRVEKSAPKESAAVQTHSTNDARRAERDTFRRLGTKPGK